MKIELKILFGGEKKPDSPDEAPRYNPASDPGYKAAVKLLKQLKPGFEKASHRMTMDEIINSLPDMQKQIINAQKIAPQAAPSANWGAINNLRTQVNPQIFQPTFAPTYSGGMFNGPNNIGQSSLQTPNQNYVYLASLLGQSPNGVK